MSPSNRIMRGKQRGKKKGGAKVAVTEGVDNPKGQPPTVKPALSIEDPWRQLRYMVMEPQVTVSTVATGVHTL